MYHPNI